MIFFGGVGNSGSKEKKEIGLLLKECCLLLKECCAERGSKVACMIRLS